jgi:hypothetical protein
LGKQFNKNRTERNDEYQASKISQHESSTEEPNTTTIQKIDKDAANRYRSDCDFRSIEPRSAGSNEQDPPNIACQQKPATEKGDKQKFCCGIERQSNFIGIKRNELRIVGL